MTKKCKATYCHSLFVNKNTFTIQNNDSNMCGFYCITFLEYMLAEKTLLDHTKLFYPNYY